MLDTQTGRLWEIVCITGSANSQCSDLELQEVPYGDERLISSTPLQPHSSKRPPPETPVNPSAPFTPEEVEKALGGNRPTPH